MSDYVDVVWFTGKRMVLHRPMVHPPLPRHPPTIQILKTQEVIYTPYPSYSFFSSHLQTSLTHIYFHVQQRQVSYLTNNTNPFYYYSKQVLTLFQKYATDHAAHKTPPPRLPPYPSI